MRKSATTRLQLWELIGKRARHSQCLFDKIRDIYSYIQVKKKAFKINAKIEDVGLKKVRKQEMVTKFS